MADPITIDNLTEGSKNKGQGTFDILMRAAKEHIVAEYENGRITGNDYADVYLGIMQTTLTQAMQFALTQDKVSLELELLEEQVLLAQDQLLTSASQRGLVESQKLKIDAEIVHLGYQDNLVIAQTAKTNQDTLNAVIEGTVLTAQECKLTAEFDLIIAQTTKVQAERDLLSVKKVTELAQTSATGVDLESVIGKQVALYSSQIEGYQRDAEQKAAKIMIDTWQTRRTMDDDNSDINQDNQLQDTDIGIAVGELLAGIVSTP